MVGRSSHRSRFVMAILAAAWCLAPSAAWSRTIAIAPYPITSVWPAAVRFLRVDRSFPVREKDESASYVLFDYTDGPKPCKGSLELIAATDRRGAKPRESPSRFRICHTAMSRCCSTSSSPNYTRTKAHPRRRRASRHRRRPARRGPAKRDSD